MVLIRITEEDTLFVANLLSDFKATQPRKKRGNIDRAMRKLRNKQPLNRLEKEAYEELIKFLPNYDFEK